MKKIRLIAFAISSLVAAAPFAGAQAVSRAPSAAGAARQGGGRGGKHEGLLRGLKLSAAERSNVKAVHAKYSAQSKQIRESLRPAMQEARADRQKGDTAAARAVFDRTKNSREALRGVMEREHNEIRAALSPANQKQFDANVKQVAASRGKGGRGWMGEKGSRRSRPSNG
jgi:Spy/CpxP family protein refolding chaperone